MLTTGYIISIFILLTIGILYQKYLEKKAKNAKYDNYTEIKKYLLKSIMNFNYLIIVKTNIL